MSYSIHCCPLADGKSIRPIALGALFLELLAFCAAMLSMDGTEGGVLALVLGKGSEAIGTGPEDGDWDNSVPQNVNRNSTTEVHGRKAFEFMAHFIQNDDCFTVFLDKYEIRIKKPIPVLLACNRWVYVWCRRVVAVPGFVLGKGKRSFQGVCCYAGAAGALEQVTHTSRTLQECD